MVIEATLFAKSLSNGNNGWLWSIKPLAYPEDILPSFASPWCVGREDLPKKTTDPGLLSILTAQNYCNFSKLPSFLIVNLYCFHTKSQFYPPPDLDLYQPLVLFVRQSWNGNNALLVMKASSLLPSSPRVFCPLLSSSVLFPFFGKPSGFLRGSASYYCCRTGYKLLQERSPAILSRMAKLERSQFYAWLIESVVIRCTYCSCCFPYSAGCIETTQTPLTRYFSDEPFFPFSCDRFLIVCPWFFFSTCVFVKRISSNRGEALILMYHFRSQFCGLKTGK